MKKLLGGYLVLLIYFLGIGFISGSIVHFTLNPWRFGLIGIVGGVLFAIATYIQDFRGRDDTDSSWQHILYRVVVGVILSIGLGMISGSIQHFDEITFEALWYIPIGTGVSLIAWWAQEKELHSGVSTRTWGLVVAGGVLLAILISGYVQKTWYPNGPVSSHGHDEGETNKHIHDDTHAHDDSISRDIFSSEEKINIHLCLMGGGENCEEIFDSENRNQYADAIAEQCELMPGMEQCNTYFGVQETVITDPFRLEPREGVLQAGSSEVVELQDGDSYTITIDEVTKTINGKTLRMLAYNGTIPGPVLKAPQGSTINLTLINNVDDIKTTMHHHGLRLDTRYDGVPVDMGGFDEPIGQGERLEYVLTFPDSGVFWYHPHVREDLQQELGLYGNYLIQGTGSDDLQKTNSEHAIMLDDVFLEDDGSMMPFDATKGNRVVMGRFGNTPLINGDTNYSLSLKQGEVTRLYLTNVANVTPFNITIPGAQMKLVGGDIGKYEREEYIENLVIAPAERYIIDVYVPQAGEWDIINQMNGEQYQLGTLSVSEETVEDSYAEQFDTLESHEGIIADIDAYRQYFDLPVEKILRLDVEMDGMEGAMPMQARHGHDDVDHDDAISLPGGLSLDPTSIERKDEMPIMNEASTTDNTRWYLVDEDSGKRNMDIDRSFDQGDVVKIRIFNDPESVHPMQHPVHFHGQRFLVIDKNGVRNENLVWKDTVLVPTGEYVDILLDASNPGTWMVHCHIAEHLTAGMMMSFDVREYGE